MFKFNFGNQNIDTKEIEEAGDEHVVWMQSTEIEINEELYSQEFLQKCRSCSSSLSCSNTTVIRHISSNDIVDVLPKSWTDTNSSFTIAKEANSDLVTAVYEGGLKIWECTVDLLNYLATSNLDLYNKKVIDLGCGAGLVGIYALLQGAFLCFQDYNIDVIKLLTIPNILLNVEDIEIVKSKAKFYCGDWESFLENTNLFATEEQKFDYIFTSETIYNPKNYKKLIAVFTKCLKKNGEIYLAAKCHYFGVGGGIKQFEDVLKQEEIFDFTTCWTWVDGIKREIIKISFKP